MVIKLVEADILPDDHEKPCSQNDKKFLKVMEEGIHITETDHYEMPLPFKMDDPDLPNNQYQAEKRLQSLRRKFTQDAIYHAEYAKVMDSLIANDYAEFIPDPAHYEKSRWYIPHHGAQYKNESLNKHLMTGQSRFRLEKVAFMCDVKEMFHQFGVNTEHRGSETT